MIAGGIIVGVIAMACFVIACFQFKEKGFLFNNAYIYASKAERASMDKKPHYRQSAIIFTLLGAVFSCTSLEMFFDLAWLFYVALGLVGIAIIYAIVSSIKMRQNKNKRM